MVSAPGVGTDRRGEGRWPVLVGMAVAASLPLFMPPSFVPGPGWLLMSIEVALLVLLAAIDPGRIDRRSRSVMWVRRAFIMVLASAAIWATGALVVDIVHSGSATSNATDLLRAGGLVWADTVLAFAFLFWEMDGDGPGERAHRTPASPDLGFPQLINPNVATPGWRPVFVDYVYLGLTNALAFSPTDVMPLSTWAKVTMGVQSVVSLLILGLVIARAVNVLS